MNQQRSVIDDDEYPSAMPGWQHRPADHQWAQALNVKNVDQAKVIHRDVAGHPWDQDGCPIALSLPLHYLPQWNLEELNGFERWKGNGAVNH